MRWWRWDRPDLRGALFPAQACSGEVPGLRSLPPAESTWYVVPRTDAVTPPSTSAGSPSKGQPRSARATLFGMVFLIFLFAPKGRARMTPARAHALP